jgi:hypothetical protein
MHCRCKNMRREKSIQVVIVFCIPPLSIAKRKSKSQRHDSQRWHEHDDNRAVDRPLTFLGRRLRRCFAHGAALRQSWRARKRHQ